MGSIVGGLYASGMTGAELQRAVEAMNWDAIFDTTPPRAGLSYRQKQLQADFPVKATVGVVKGRLRAPDALLSDANLLLELRRLLAVRGAVASFDQLPIPFRAVATDIETGHRVVLDRGELAGAMRASMSVPGVFAPYRMNGKLLVDGGMVDNVPVDEARKLGAERLIVVAVGTGLSKEEDLNSPFAVADQMLTALMQNRSRAQIATLGPHDLFIQPELGDINAARFDRAAEAIKIGEASAENARADVARFTATQPEYDLWLARHHLPESGAPIVQFVNAGGEERRFAHNVGKPFDAAAFERDVAVMYGEGRHESIAWRLTTDDRRTGVDIDAEEKAWGPNFLRLGLELSDNFDGRSSYQALVQARFTSLNDKGGEGLARLQLGRVFDARLEFYQPWGWDRQFSVAPYLRYRALNIPLRAEPGDETYIAEIHRSEFVGGLELGWNPSSHWRLSTGVETGHEDARIQVGAVGVPGVAGDVGLVRGRVEYDTLDSVTYPSHGMRVDLSTELYTPVLGAQESADATRLAIDAAFGQRRNHLLLGLQLAYSNGGENTIGVSSKMGGLANLSGYLADEIVADELGLARAIYYRRLTSDSQILGLPLYAGASVELGGFWGSRDEIERDDLVTAGSLFIGIDSFVGPIFLGYGRADTGVDSFYLRFGPLLRSELRL